MILKDGCQLLWQKQVASDDALGTSEFWSVCSTGNCLNTLMPSPLVKNNHRHNKDLGSGPAAPMSNGDRAHGIDRKAMTTQFS